MKRLLINENEKKQILNLYYSNSIILNEQAWLRRLIGKSADDLVRFFGDDAVKTFEMTLSKALSKPTNFVAKNGETFLMSARGGEGIPMSQIEDAIKIVSKGEVSAQEVANMLPRNLPDGTELRKSFLDSFSKKIEGVTQPGIKKTFTPMSEMPPNEIERLLTKLDDAENIKGWRYFGPSAWPMSGWKFHVYGEDLYDSVFLYERLKPLAQKWGAHAKVAGENIQVFTDKASNQWGKQGATIYIPPRVIANGQAADMLADIQRAISGYTKKGSIKGEQMVTDNIGYRYELNSPINPKKGVGSYKDGGGYRTNTGGDYKPNDVVDLFSIK